MQSLNFVLNSGVLKFWYFIFKMFLIDLANTYKIMHAKPEFSETDAYACVSMKHLSCLGDNKKHFGQCNLSIALC